jgi:putative transposase
VRHPPKPVPEEVMKKGVRELTKEGVQIDREELQEESKGLRAFLPRRWIVERTFSWLGQNRRMSKDYERLPESGEAFIYVAMSRLMVRRLARL